MKFKLTKLFFCCLLYNSSGFSQLPVAAWNSYIQLSDSTYFFRKPGETSVDLKGLYNSKTANNSFLTPDSVFFYAQYRLLVVNESDSTECYKVYNYSGKLIYPDCVMGTAEENPDGTLTASFEISSNNDGGVFILMNSNEKMGAVNYNGESILPFIYSDLRFTEAWKNIVETKYNPATKSIDEFTFDLKGNLINEVKK